MIRFIPFVKQFYKEIRDPIMWNVYGWKQPVLLLELRAEFCT